MASKIAGRYSVCYCVISLPGVGYIEGIRPGIIEIAEDNTAHLEGFKMSETVFHSFNEDFEFKTDTTFADAIDVNSITWHANEIKNWKAGKVNGNNITIVDGQYLEMILHDVTKMEARGDC